MENIMKDGDYRIGKVLGFDQNGKIVVKTAHDGEVTVQPSANNVPEYGDKVSIERNLDDSFSLHANFGHIER
jgi:hypothetical protein